MTDEAQHNYAINGADIVFEEYPDEMVLANMKRGVYYTLNPVGADFFRALTQAPSRTVAEAWLHEVYPTENGKIGPLVDAFIEELLRESIVVETAAEPSDGPVPLPATLRPGATPPGAPALTKYDDVEELLRLDPIHEVEHESGWPTATEAEEPS